MKIDAILGGSLSIIFFGLALALPEMSSQLLYDFSQVSEVPLNIIRIGLILVGFYFLNAGLEAKQ